MRYRPMFPLLAAVGVLSPPLGSSTTAAPTQAAGEPPRLDGMGYAPPPRWKGGVGASRKRRGESKLERKLRRANARRR